VLGVLDGVVELLLRQGAPLPAGSLHLLGLLEAQAQVLLDDGSKGQVVGPQQGGRPVSVEHVGKLEPVIPVQDPDVVVAGVDDLDLVGIGENPAEKGQVHGRVKGVDEVDALLRPDLQQAELLPEIAERIVLRVDGDHRGALDIIPDFRKFLFGVHPQPLALHAARLTGFFGLVYKPLFRELQPEIRERAGQWMGRGSGPPVRGAGTAAPRRRSGSPRRPGGLRSRPG